MTPKNENPTPAKAEKFAVVKAFWLGDKLFEAGTEVQLTASQAKRLGEGVQAVKAG